MSTTRPLSEFKQIDLDKYWVDISLDQIQVEKKSLSSRIFNFISSRITLGYVGRHHGLARVLTKLIDEEQKQPKPLTNNIQLMQIDVNCKLYKKAKGVLLAHQKEIDATNLDPTLNDPKNPHEAYILMCRLKKSSATLEQSDPNKKTLENLIAYLSSSSYDKQHWEVLQFAAKNSEVAIVAILFFEQAFKIAPNAETKKQMIKDIAKLEMRDPSLKNNQNSIAAKCLIEVAKEDFNEAKKLCSEEEYNEQLKKGVFHSAFKATPKDDTTLKLHRALNPLNPLESED